MAGGSCTVAQRGQQHLAQPCLFSVLWQLPLLCCAQRMFASQTEGELKVTQILKENFPQATAIKVTDISGGCGAMYEIHIESEEFKEKRTVQQHQMVNQALKEEIKGMHGLRIFTSVPKH
ncbi:PREDICTED: bolA-like protein 3 [Miniopterus natalensis]|uniref:bolA-like protein 3 n=1 Tax=Miniopterus natalensis TaxID=291302 RepID=UPI0007A6CE2E|nr:PREDICTED: bolA-like protein 3 [Miniopterus natalensis]